MHLILWLAPALQHPAFLFIWNNQKWFWSYSLVHVCKCILTPDLLKASLLVWGAERADCAQQCAAEREWLSLPPFSEPPTQRSLMAIIIQCGNVISIRKTGGLLCSKMFEDIPAFSGKPSEPLWCSKAEVTSALHVFLKLFLSDIKDFSWN